MAETPDEDYLNGFYDLIGTTESAETYSGNIAAGFEIWMELYEGIGIDRPTPEEDVAAFQEFLLAFYPQDKSPEEWWADRQEFYDDYDVGDENIDWELYREAIDSP